jgi:hypothetical protein
MSESVKTKAALKLALSKVPSGEGSHYRFSDSGRAACKQEVDRKSSQQTAGH